LQGNVITTSPSIVIVDSTSSLAYEKQKENRYNSFYLALFHTIILFFLFRCMEPLMIKIIIPMDV
jgi:hypothetical protein